MFLTKMFEMKKYIVLTRLNITRAKADGSDYIVLLRNGRMRTKDFFRTRN